MPQDEWSDDSVARILTNPLYCLVEPAVVSEDQWIKANAKIIRGAGEEGWGSCGLNRGFVKLRIEGRILNECKSLFHAIRDKHWLLDSGAVAERGIGSRD